MKKMFYLFVFLALCFTEGFAYAGSLGHLSSKNTNKINLKHSSKIPPPQALPMVVIDAGHGGVDSGTIGASGVYEKNVVLEYAQLLRARLLKSNKYRAALTRDGDYFIPLRKRVEIARKAGAKLFISLHADSADEAAAHGLSVYTVSEQASDKEAAALAARENKSDIIGGMDLSDARPDVADILISLAQRETKTNSAFFADLLVLMLGDRVHLLPNTHRFAGFAVLKAPDIPSVLIEIGFLSHKQEEKALKSNAYRDKIISGIVAGIDTYFTKKSHKKNGVKL
jgi:N-acetylmuramoyl-L-alanine amidase